MSNYTRAKPCIKREGGAWVVTIHPLCYKGKPCTAGYFRRYKKWSMVRSFIKGQYLAWGDGYGK